jgi:hypothetical protein
VATDGAGGELAATGGAVVAGTAELAAATGDEIAVVMLLAAPVIPALPSTGPAGAAPAAPHAVTKTRAAPMIADRNASKRGWRERRPDGWQGGMGGVIGDLSGHWCSWWALPGPAIEGRTRQRVCGQGMPSQTTTPAKIR